MNAFAVSQTGVGLPSLAERDAMLKQIEVRKNRFNLSTVSLCENTKASLKVWCFCFGLVFWFSNQSLL
ncbi:hypothetical protein F0225_16840 [Vibrio pectenicida]|uniref:Uncharacterized protein n=1 Tax=Vibrio pectenicida TaxID=62763 RepID=A0A7Y4A1U8_9VIBR|nr:hypothetical protein [Vibrio pectenicida]NOH72988.1 hypothetical protein [Vibrio pectenicida]